jgi:hypothetical protein
MTLTVMVNIKLTNKAVTPMATINSTSVNAARSLDSFFLENIILAGHRCGYDQDAFGLFATATTVKTSMKGKTLRLFIFRKTGVISAWSGIIRSRR